MTSWNPQPAGLQEILLTIHESTDMNATVQRNITHVRLKFTTIGLVFIQSQKYHRN